LWGGGRERGGGVGGQNSKIKKWFLVPLTVLNIKRSHSRSFGGSLKGIEPKTVSLSSCVALELVPLQEEKNSNYNRTWGLGPLGVLSKFPTSTPVLFIREYSPPGNKPFYHALQIW